MNEIRCNTNTNTAFLVTAAPLGAYFLLKAMGWFTAGLITAAILLILLCSLLLRQFKWVDLTFLAFFVVMLICVSWLNIEWMSTYRNVFAPAMLAVLAWGSVLLGKPFTEQYARERIQPVWWDNPHFHRVNRILAWIWGSAFASGAVLALISAHYHDVLPYWISVCVSGGLSLAAGGFTIWFPKWYRHTIYLPQAGPNPLPE